MNSSPYLSLVIPAYNEELNIYPLYQEILATLNQLNLTSYQIIFVDDGSSDKTFEIIMEIAKENPYVLGIALSKNFGNQNALKAGLEHASGEFIISMDADLQQPPALIKEMLEAVNKGYDVVLTKRLDTGADFRILAASAFYYLINTISNVSITYGSSDFRLLSRKALDSLLKFSEYNTFFRGLIPHLGFKQFIIEYKARQRHSGKSKLNLKKLMQLALNGITSSSILPLRLGTLMGLGISFVAFLYLAYALYIKLVLKDLISGWTSLIISVLFLGGIQLLILGIIGEYLGKIFFEVKKRPSYIIAQTTGLLVSHPTRTHEDR